MFRSLLCLATLVLGEDSFAEDLKIWRVSETLSLLDFEFKFELPSDHQNNLDSFPPQVHALIEQIPSISSLKADLVQGRWHESFTPRVNGFSGG